ncbi:pantoate--beta-alanine ligase [Thermocrinis minervae]|uniref:Pantothenate synthetase n=1 Tax=Thermocrinis minervae TaxID=381751 RepID=A0A1M6T4S7_9AQUI|nr:pantoate--beta-alanine ligase [Thermocrinis minervae]SHK51947.1 pantoate--beta-alanine ligase [Thermocrinis minervae]
MPKLFRKVREIRNFLRSFRCSNDNSNSIGFVPTMGYLHKGHRELIRRSKLQNDLTVVSIYVNPLQFGPGEDYETYPRDLERDLTVCEEEGVDVVFAPTDDEMYPEKPTIKIEIPGLTDVLEGAYRPGHFSGVATVVLKLFNIIQPDRAYFGEKDFQQLKVVQRLVKDLSIPIEIVPVPTVREEDGLAASSRNTYLKEEERQAATVIYRSLLLAQKLFSSGTRNAKDIKEAVLRALLSEKLVSKVDYVEIVDEEFRIRDDQVMEGDRLLVALRVGKVRLIDNWRFGDEAV